MQIVDRNRLNQTEVVVRLSDGSERRLRLGAGVTRAIETFPARQEDDVLVAAADYALIGPSLRAPLVFAHDGNYTTAQAKADAVHSVETVSSRAGATA
jgi:hypothetical protein